MLSAANLTLWRGPNCLFENLSFQVGAGSALLIGGANGAGKTTLLRVLCGLTRPESGEISWQGQPIAAADDEFAQQLAYCGHRTGLKADLTVAQNLDFFARINGQHPESWHTDLETFQLGHCKDLEVRYLSTGQQRRVAMTRLLMSAARLWILDEPFSNLDDAGRKLVKQRLDAHLSTDGLAVIASHHELELNSGPATEIRLGGQK